MEISISAGGIVMNNKNKFVLVYQKNASWSFPKGRIDKGENPLATAKREIYEETGINKLELVKKLEVYQRYTLDKSVLRTLHLFLFKTDQKTLKPNDKDIKEAKWLEKEEVIKLLPHKEDIEAFLKAIN